MKVELKRRPAARARARLGCGSSVKARKDRLLAGRQVGRRAAFHSSQELAGQVREKRSQFRIDWSSFALRAGLGGGLGPRQRRR